MITRRICKLAGVALVAAVVPLSAGAGAAGAADTPSLTATVTRTEIENTEETARAIDALREGAMNPVGTMKELTDKADEAAKHGLSAESASYFQAAVAMATTEWEYVAKNSTDFEERLEAQYQATEHGLGSLADVLWQGTVTLMAQYASQSWNDPSTLQRAVAHADKLGMKPQANVLWQGAVALIVHKAAHAAQSSNEPTTQSSIGATTGSGSTTGSIGSANDGGATPAGSAGNRDPIFGTDRGGSTTETTSTNAGGVPSGATRTGYTREPKSEATSASEGSTNVYDTYISSETYSYSDEDGTQHERTVTYDEDGEVTSVVDTVVEDDTTDGQCAEDGCGNPDAAVAGSPTTVPPACKVDGCNTGGDDPVGADPTADADASPAPTTCDPTGYHEGDCAPVEILPVPEVGTPMAEPCAADGCPHPDLAPPPHGDPGDIPGWAPYARP